MARWRVTARFTRAEGRGDLEVTIGDPEVAWHLFQTLKDSSAWSAVTHGPEVATPHVPGGHQHRDRGDGVCAFCSDPITA